MALVILSLLFGVVWGWGFYQAVFHHSQFWCVMCATFFGLYEMDRSYKSEIIRGFIKGLTQ